MFLYPPVSRGTSAIKNAGHLYCLNTGYKTWDMKKKQKSADFYQDPFEDPTGEVQNFQYMMKIVGPFRRVHARNHSLHVILERIFW